MRKVVIFCCGLSLCFFAEIMKSFESTLILKSECDKLDTWFAYNANMRKRRHNYDTYAEEVDGLRQGI